MKTHIWNITKSFPDKVNFIDSNNVLLGYDLGQSCCETAFWTISEALDGSNPIHRGDAEQSQEIELEDYCFDPAFYRRIDDEYEETHVAIFKLNAYRGWDSKNLPDLYLRLENHHNGYYSHGFVFKGDTIIENSL